MFAAFLIVSTLSSNISALSQSPAKSGHSFVASFRCPSTYPTEHALKEGILNYFNWVNKNHKNWTVNQALEFRYALLQLHDCTTTIDNLKHHMGIKNEGYPYVASTLLPITDATKMCIRPHPEKLPMTRINKIKNLRNKATNEDSAFDALKNKAMGGDPIAAFYTAVLFDPTVAPDVTTAEKNWHKADYWYLKAAKSGIAAAQISIGNSFAKGTGVPKDENIAVHWYRLAAQNGWVDGAWNMGVAYEKGRGVKKSLKQSLRWYCAAGLEGDKEAQWHLAATYYEGEGVPRNIQKSLYWLHILATEGDPMAPMMIKAIEQDGTDVPVMYN